jgi:hypothetical protein
LVRSDVRFAGHTIDVRARDPTSMREVPKQWQRCSGLW